MVIVPLQELGPQERFLLLVTLMDGTAIPFTIAAGKELLDGQVDVFPKPESPEANRKALEEKRKENKVLRAENRRREQEESSVDHALAALLSNNEISMTPFKVDQKWRMTEPGVEVEVSILVPKGRAAMDRGAVLFQVTNRDTSRPWKLQEARLTDPATLEQKPFALRMVPSVISAGKTGRIAVITDLSLLDSKAGSDKLVLEIFRDGGLQQGYVELELRYRR